MPTVTRDDTPGLRGFRRGTWAVRPGFAWEMLLVVGAGLMVVAFVGTSALRLVFPYPLEITEGASLEAVKGLLAGQPLYSAPTVEHVSQIYGPVYFYVCAVLARLTGPTYLTLRLVSLLASIGSVALAWLLVRRETGSAASGVLAGGLLAASNPLTDGALDLGRVDAMLVCLLLGSVYAARHDTARMGIVSGGLMGLAVLTKQAAVPVALALGAYYVVAPFLYRRVAPGVTPVTPGVTPVTPGVTPVTPGVTPGVTVGVTPPAYPSGGGGGWWAPVAGARRVGAGPLGGFALGLAASLAIPVVLLELQSGHWATLFLIDLPRQHEISDQRLGLFWTLYLLPHFTLALALGSLFLLARARANDYRSVTFYVLSGASMVGIAWASSSSWGAAANVRLPAYAILAILFALGLHEGLRQLSRLGNEHRAYWAYGIAVGLFQLALVAYNPRLLVPYRSDGWASDRLVAALAALPGSVYAPDFDAYVRQSGRPEQPYSGSAAELLGGYGGSAVPEGLAWIEAAKHTLRQREFNYVVLDPESSLFFFRTALGETGYVDAGPLLRSSDEFWLWRSRITPKAQVYVPVERLAAEKRPE